MSVPMTFRCDPALAGRLPKPAAARTKLPDWLRQMPATAFSDQHGADVRTVKQCPPFIDAMMFGVVFTLPCDVSVIRGAFSWDWDIPAPISRLHPRSPLSFFSSAQVAGSPFERDDQIVVKFNCFWTVELPKGWALYATAPINRHDLPFKTLTGLVDSDRYHDVGILFPAIWTNPEFSGVLTRGTPIAQCFPVPRAAPELSFESFDEQQVARHDQVGQLLLDRKGVYRKKFRAPRSSGSDERLR